MTIVLTYDGEVVAFGKGPHGFAQGKVLKTPTTFTGFPSDVSIKQICCGSFHAMALVTDKVKKRRPSTIHHKNSPVDDNVTALSTSGLLVSPAPTTIPNSLSNRSHSPQVPDKDKILFALMDRVERLGTRIDKMDKNIDHLVAVKSGGSACCSLQ